MKAYVFEKIKALVKERDGCDPQHITRLELLNAINSDVTDCLNELYQEGKIDAGPTLNDTYISLKNENNKTKQQL